MCKSQLKNQQILFCTWVWIELDASQLSTIKLYNIKHTQLSFGIHIIEYKERNVP